MGMNRLKPLDRFDHRNAVFTGNCVGLTAVLGKVNGLKSSEAEPDVINDAPKHHLF